MILYGASISPFVRKVLMFAAEKGITLDHKPVTPHADDERFKAASPLGKIPALVDGDYTLADSTAIVTYLEAKFPAHPLIPLEAKARGKAIWYEEFADTVIFPVGTVLFLNRVLLPKVRNIPGDSARADEMAKQLPALFSYLENVVTPGFLVGDSLSIGDIAITSMLVNLSYSGGEIDAAQYPQLAAYFARIAARPSISGLIAGERQFLGI